MNSLFVTFEGGEGAGKTSLMDQIEKDLIAKRLPVLRVREPGGTWLGEKVRSILLDQAHAIAPLAELALFLASRAQHLFDIILPALKEGKIVLCDRYHDSTIAYQGAARGLGEEKVAAACDLFCHHRWPDLTFYLDIDPKIGLERASKVREKDRIEQEAIAFHETIRKSYLKCARADTKRICVIDASLPPEQVFTHARALLDQRLHHVR